MHPLSDKDLDRLSKEAAEQYDVDQNTSGWEKLEQKLNKHLPETGKKERRRFLFFIWLLALLSGGGLLSIMTINHAPLLTASKRSSPDIELPDSKKKESGQLPSSVDNSDPKRVDAEKKGNDPLRPTPVNESKVTQKRNGVISQKPGQQNKTSVSSGDDEIRTGIITLDGNRRTKARKNNGRPLADQPSQIPVTKEAGDGLVKQDAQKTASPTGKDQVKDISSQSAPVAQNPTTLPADAITESVAKQASTDSVSNSISKKSVKTKNRGDFKKGLELGIAGAPDMSNVKFKNTEEPGFNVGVQLGYRLSQRWSVNTGVLYTKKIYSSRGKDFNPPKGTWLDNVKLDKVEGSCYMFDIPLNIRYDLNTNANQRFFVNTGLSTYLMKKEDYHYHYQYANGSPGYRYRSLSSDGNHWLSIVNISAGFEKKLNKHFSLQAEPYLKIPLDGVGFGNLQLNSYGMYFSLKYKPGLHFGKK